MEPRTESQTLDMVLNHNIRLSRALEKKESELAQAERDKESLAEALARAESEASELEVTVQAREAEIFRLSAKLRTFEWIARLPKIGHRLVRSTQPHSQTA